MIMGLIALIGIITIAGVLFMARISDKPEPLQNGDYRHD